MGLTEIASTRLTPWTLQLIMPNRMIIPISSPGELQPEQPTAASRVDTVVITVRDTVVRSEPVAVHDTIVITARDTLFLPLEDIGLDTDVRIYSGPYSWPVADGSVHVRREWRFLFGEEWNYRISYVTVWENKTQQALEVSFRFSFRDAQGFPVYEQRTEFGWPTLVTLQPGVSREVSGTYHVRVANVVIANSIDEMTIKASFRELD
jgi:hypothetical protein